jgi:hypothetical protein
MDSKVNLHSKTNYTTRAMLLPTGLSTAFLCTRTLFGYNRSFSAAADSVRQQPKPLRQRDINAARSLLTSKNPSSCDQSLSAPIVVAREGNGNTVPAKTATANSTRRPVIRKKRDKADLDKKQPRKKQGHGKQVKKMLAHTDQGPCEVIHKPRSTIKTRQELEAARMFVEKYRSEEEKETDQADDQNVMMVTEYRGEILEHLLLLEARLKPKGFSISARPQSYWKKRADQMNWLIEVHDELELLPEILFLAVNVFDRYLEGPQVTDSGLQLFGATSLFIATKYEDDDKDYTSVRENLLDMAGHAFSDEELLKTEVRMLESLHYDLGWPGPLSFVRRISRADNYDATIRTLCKYFLDVAVLDKRFVDCIPSFLSAGAYRLSQLMLNTSGWVFLCPFCCWRSC